LWEEDGSFALRARLCADEGAVVLRALEAAREALRERRAAEAAEAAEAAADPDACPAECRVSNAEALAETAGRFACDGAIVELVERAGEPLARGRKRRTVSAALRRALASRDRGCRFPGCDSTRFVEAHHVQHWVRGGETNLDNLISLCRRHHRLVHERGYSLRLDDEGERQFVNEYGVAIPSVPRPPPPFDREALRRRQRDLAIDETTCCTGAGDRMDLGLAVDAVAAAAGAW
jgi:hypothetical protein